MGDNPDHVPSVTWLKTRKGRGYLKYDNPVHGVPHAMNSEIFWQTKKPFSDKYGVKFHGCDEPAPAGADFTAQTLANIQVVMSVLKGNQALVDYLADRLVELGDLDGARQQLEALAAIDPSDGPTRYYLDITAEEGDAFSRPSAVANR